MFNDSIMARGKLIISLDNKIVRICDNLVVTVGKEWITSRMKNAADGVMTHIAIGEGTTTAIVADTALETEVARVAVDVSGGTVVNRIITFTATIPADVPNITAPATSPITEAAIFNAASAGIMLARTVFPVINKAETASMSISWAVTIN
jgi:hypothetical protein